MCVAAPLPPSEAPRSRRNRPRCLRTTLVHPGLGDGDVLTLLGQDDPCGQVNQHAYPEEDREDGEPEPDQVHVNAEMLGHARADPRDQLALPAAVQTLAVVFVVFAHSPIMPTSGANVPSGMSL